MQQVEDLRMRIVGEFADSALLKAFGEGGAGVLAEQRAGLGKVERQPDALRCSGEELAPLASGELWVGVVGGRQVPVSPSVDGRAGVEMGTELLDQADLFVVAHF